MRYTVLLPERYKCSTYCLYVSKSIALQRIVQVTNVCHKPNHLIISSSMSYSINHLQGRGGCCRTQAASAAHLYTDSLPIQAW